MAAIMSSGAMARSAVLQAEPLVRLAPDADSLVWWPARAVLGDGAALTAVLATSLALLAGAIALFAGRFGEHAAAAQSVALGVTKEQRNGGFRPRSARPPLRQKERTPLRRAPCLVSHTLRHIPYL